MTSNTEKNQPKKDETFEDKDLAFALEKILSVLADKSAIIVEDLNVEKILNY